MRGTVAMSIRPDRLRAFLRRIAAWSGHVPALLLARSNIRFLPVRTDRVGHLAIDPDCFVKEGLLGMRAPQRAILCAPGANAANAWLAEAWRKYMWVVRSRWLCLALKPLSMQPCLQFDVARYSTAIGRTGDFVEIQKRWGKRAPLLRLHDREVRAGRERLRSMGLPEDAWFVCVHVREGGYSPADEHVHSFRNASIASYAPAIAEIARRGGWCIRVGDASMRELPQPMPGVLDYARSAVRADWMDIFLFSHCRFLLGTSSGPAFLCGVLGTPVATANMIPPSVVLPFGAADIGIPKLLRRRDGSLMSFAEAFASPVANFRFAEEFRRAGLEIVDNTPEDVLDLAVEQLDRLDGTLTYCAEDERLQARFKSLMRPGHYTFGSQSRVGRGFLRRHAHLL